MTNEKMVVIIETEDKDRVCDLLLDLREEKEIIDFDELSKEEIEILKIDELMIINNMKKNDDISRKPIEIREKILKKLEKLK